MILVVPASESGRGGGHLVRSTKLVSGLQLLGKEAALYNSSIKINNIDLIILDRFQTPSGELDKWKIIAPVIGIDEGGKKRDSFDFLIDILPNIEAIRPNICDVSLLPLPKIEHDKDSKIESANTEKKIKVLVSFGMEDAAGLSEKVYKIFNSKKYNNFDFIFLNSNNRIYNLSEHLHEYDLIITHFGITAFESLYAKTPVILLNPTPYHEKLSKSAGFKTLRLRSFKKFNLHLDSLKKNCDNLASIYGLDKEPNNLASLIANLSLQVNKKCPVCKNETPAKSIARFEDRTYRQCEKCSIIYMDRLNEPAISYGQEYFFEIYKQQYGKTYLEDFPKLKRIARKRIEIIKKISGKNKESQKKLLDIGCAYGAFLQVAKENRFEPRGIDPCKEAIGYVKNELGINATHSFFPIPSGEKSNSYDIITLWFTIEHFRDCVSVLEEIKKLLKKGGILAFSTPSFSGISARKNLRSFLFNSPGDHYTIWSLKMCKKALSPAGFKIKKKVSCGHHPERFPFFGKFSKSKRSPVYWTLLALSKIFKLGDTFEVYAVKK